MKHAAEHTKALSQLMQKLAKRVAHHPPPQRTPVEQLIFSFLEYDSTHLKAEHAYERLMRHMVDLNDLRVSDPMDIAAVIGPKYPRVAERAARLRASLNTIYRREHAVDLAPVAGKTKRDVRAYLDSLEGVVPYVAAAVTLLSFGGHAIPLDQQLYRKLLADHVLEPGATFEEASTFLDHHIRFEDAVEAHLRLRAYVDRDIPFDGEEKKRKKPRKTTKARR